MLLLASASHRDYAGSMSGRFMSIMSILLFLAAATPAVAAGTYKWVDDNGVVNYSNTPPPEKFAKASVVGERISVVPTDPALGAAIAAMNVRAAQRAQYEEADWQMRQRYLLATARPSSAPNAYGAGYDVYAAPYYPVAYVPFFTVRTARPSVPFRPAPFLGRRSP
jgi:hypothetical protein